MEPAKISKHKHDPATLRNYLVIKGMRCLECGMHKHMVCLVSSLTERTPSGVGIENRTTLRLEGPRYA